MKTPEFSSHPESRIEKINLQDGETAYFDGEKYQAGVDPEYGYPYAKGDTFIVGKNGPELEAHGGPCAVVSFYERGSKIGAVLHIDVANIWHKAHVDDMVEKIVVALSNAPAESTEVHLFGDDEYHSMPEEARAWRQMITESLQRHFSQIGSFTKGDSKYVRLNTETGKLRVFDIDNRLIFSKE